MLLKAILKHIPNLVREGFVIFKYLHKEVNRDAINVSFDVVNLSTTTAEQCWRETIGLWLENLPNR